jgi:hypothetical protein
MFSSRQAFGKKLMLNPTSVIAPTNNKFFLMLKKDFWKYSLFHQF